MTPGKIDAASRHRTSPCYLPCRGMVRRAIALSLLTGAAGCGGSGYEPPQPVERSTADVAGDIRSPDARSLETGVPLVSAAGRWRCATAGSIELHIGSGAEATLSSGGRPLALVSDGRALVNRECDRGRGGALPSIGTPRVADGSSLLRCESPPFVLVGFDDGDLTVRDAEGGRFLAGAAVSYDHPAVAGYWTAGCARL
jgi:hypothetical protein